MRWDRYEFGWPEYVPVGQRIAAATKRAESRAKRSGRKPEPVTIAGRDITKTFWGKSWCRNLESYGDFASRLPRGRTYVRNGSVVDLAVTRGRVEAVVAGSMVYDVAIALAPLSPVKWRAIKAECASSIGSLVDLLTGRLDHDVMRRLVKPGDGMFPSPREINVTCSCPDGARVCKHLAAVFYGIGHRLDTQPELLFLLRGVDQAELVAAATKESVSKVIRGDDAHTIAADDLAGVFGIDLGGSGSAEPPPAAAGRRRPVAATKRPARSKAGPARPAAAARKKPKAATPKRKSKKKRPGR